MKIKNAFLISTFIIKNIFLSDKEPKKLDEQSATNIKKIILDSSSPGIIRSTSLVKSIWKKKEENSSVNNIKREITPYPRDEKETIKKNFQKNQDFNKFFINL